MKGEGKTVEDREQGAEGWGRTWGQESTGAIFNAIMKPYTWYANF